MLALSICSFALLAPARAELRSGDLEARAEACLQSFVRSARVPGVTAGIATKERSLALAAGVRERGKEAALEPGDLMCAGSTGKTFVAAVVLQLVAEGELTVDALAGEYLGAEPWFARLPNADELTVENLLSHRSGLPRYELDAAFTRDLLAQPDRVWRPDELLAYVLDREPAVPANDGFAYADTNYIVLGMIVERVTGATLHAEIERRVLAPHSLDGIRAQDARTIPGLVQGHAGPRDPLGFPELVLDADGRFAANPQFEWAGGGFVSSGGALARWGRALYAGDVLSRAMRERMLSGSPAPGLGRGARYGLGVIVWSTPRGEAWGHEGFFPGYMSRLCYWPDHDVAIAVQVNTSEPAALPRPLAALCDELLALVLETAAPR